MEHFIRVLIPAILGDEFGDYKPENGRYKNSIVSYERTGTVFLYDSEGAYTLISDGVCPEQ